MQAIERIRRAVRAQRYRVSAHANDEMDADQAARYWSSRRGQLTSEME
jgi:hypothetical protein